MSQRVLYLRNFIAWSTLVGALVSMPALVLAQGMPGGGLPSLPQSMFGKKQDNREPIGPSLSATDENVSAIRVVGNTTIPTDQVLNQLQTRVGRPFDPALVQRDVRKLAGRGWFVDVQPTYEQAPDGRIVIFKVVERPVVRYVEYLGNSGLREKKLAKETDLKVGGPVDPYAVQEARRRLVDLYHRNGYNNVQISILEGDKPTDDGIVFVINEGLAQKIWKVEFVGNEFVSSSRLKTKIDSKPPIAYLFKGYVDRDQIDADANKLTAYYRSFGYFDAKIGKQFEFDEKNKWLTLRFIIHEGVRYQVDSVAFIGNKLFASESLASGVELKPDSTQEPPLQRAYHKIVPLPPGPRPFEQDKMNADVAWLKELYGSQGYVFADIKAEPIFLEEQGKLKLMYHIDEGKRWRVGNIYVHIAGDNPHTKIQTALNRLSFKSGQVADIREIRASERRLQASGLFMADPARGVMPKIVYHIPDGSKTEIAKGDNGFRGQSPDAQRGVGSGERGIQLLPAPDLPAAAPTLQAPIGPPLIAPPNSAFATQPQPQVTYKVEAAPVAAPSDELVDVHMYIEDTETTAAAVTIATEPAPPATPATGPVRYEARRPPYDDASAPNNQYQNAQYAAAPQTGYPQAYPTYPAATAPAYPATAPAPASSSATPYGKLVVRTQSPYQPATTPASQSTSPTYGGQQVGGTGPDATAVGSNPYAVKQVAITEPQLPPSGPAPAFGPPPLTAPVAEPLPAPPGAPQYAPMPTQQYAPVPQGAPMPGGPAPVQLGPDGRITPVPPISTTPYPTDPFTPSQMWQDPAVDMDVVLSEGQTGRLMLGVAVNSDAGLVGQILFDEQSFDIGRYPTSWQDIVDGKAWRGGGQRFRMEAAPGTQVQRYLVSFAEPYLFDSPYSLGLSGSYFTRRYRDWDEQRVGGRGSIGYQWVENDLSTSIAYRGEDVLVDNPSNPALPQLAEVLGHNAVHGFKWTIANDTRDSAFLATEGHFLQMELEQVVGSFQYPRAIFDARQYVLLNQRPDYSGRHVLTLATKVGFTGDNTPIYDTFYAGGFTTLRGFDFRGASPVVQNVQVGGDFEFLNTVEYLFPLTADDMIHGVAFCDFGTVNENVTLKNFRVAPGLGLRITVPAMGPAPIALDFAFPVTKDDTDDTQVFSFSVGLQR